MIQTRQPTFQNIVDHVHKVGGGAPAVFGSSHMGGYYVEQVPFEIAGCICYLHENGWSNIDNYLEIGSAAGGCTKLLSDYFDLNKVYIIDNNMHPAHGVRKSLLYGLDTTEFVGDSHSASCRRAIKSWGQKFDFIHIDGDHSYHGVREDTLLVRNYIKDGGLVMFHDVQIVPEVKMWYDQLVAGAISELKHLKSFICPRLPCCGIGLFQFHFDPEQH